MNLDTMVARFIALGYVTSGMRLVYSGIEEVQVGKKKQKYYKSVTPFYGIADVVIC